MTSLEDGQARDRGITQLLSGAVSVEDAVSLIGQIQSQEQRMNAILNAAANMTLHDPDGARALLRRYPLDPQRQQQFDAFQKQQRKRRR